MPDLKLLRPLVSYCNLTGLFPFYMEIDPVSNSFKRFTLSFHKLHVWWFALVVILQAALSVYALYSIVNAFENLKETCSSVLMQISFITLVITIAVAFVAPKIFFFSYRRIEKACLLIKEVDDMLWLVDDVPSTTTLQIIIFIGLSSAFVSSITFHNYLT